MQSQARPQFSIPPPGGAMPSLGLKEYETKPEQGQSDDEVAINKGAGGLRRESRQDHMGKKMAMRAGRRNL